MAKIIRLTESDLYRLVKRVIREQDENLSSAERLFKYAMNSKTIGEFGKYYEELDNLMTDIIRHGTEKDQEIYHNYEKKLRNKFSDLRSEKRF